MLKPNKWLDCPPRPVLLRSLRRSTRGGRHRRGTTRRRRCARTSRATRRQCRFSRRYGRSVLAERRRNRRRCSRASSNGAATSSPHWCARFALRCGRTRPSRSSRRCRGQPAARGTREAICARWRRQPASSRRAFTSRVSSGCARTSAMRSAGLTGWEGCAASFARAFRICRVAPTLSPPRKRFATPEFPRSRSTTTVTCAAAILPGSRRARRVRRLIVEFSNKVVAITGASGGIGQELCRHFGGQGAAIAAVDRSEAVTAFAESAPERGDHNRIGRRRYRRAGSGGRPRSRGLPRCSARSTF